MIKELEIALRRLALNIFLILSKRKTSQSKPDVTSKSKVLFIRLNRIGDALVTTPLLHQIKTQLGCSIFVLADKNNHFVFGNCPPVDKTIIFEKGWKGIQRVKSYIKKNNIDTVVDLHDDVSTSVSFLLSSIVVDQIFGLNKENAKLYTHTVERLDSTTHHIIERTLELTKLFGFNPDFKNAKVDYKISIPSLQIATSILSKFDNKFKIGINITAGSAARFWGVNNYSELISLLKNYDVHYIIFTNEEYFDQAKQITEEKNIYPPSQDFDIFAAGISKLNMLFTPDTSIIHICAEYKIPIFGLYVKYKTDDMIWSPYNSEFEAVITEEPTLKNVSFREVKDKFIPFLEKHLNVKRNS